MRSPLIGAVRSVDLTVPDLARAERFYTQVWQLTAAAKSPGVLYLRGSGTDHHVLALHEAPGATQIRYVTLRARNAEALSRIAAGVHSAGGTLEQRLSPSTDPARGQHIVVRDPHGRRFEIVHADELRRADSPAPPDQPERIAHVVLNSHDLASTQQFLESVLGFVLSDRTKIMAFMNCDLDHHSIAIGDSDNTALNHIAFLMPTLDAVMRGGGRMLDAGHTIEWGPGRHGPGGNAFNYFIDPFGVVIEYTAEIEQIDETYRPGSPADWSWPSGRSDQWGVSKPPSPRLKDAQRAVFFSP